MIDILPVVKLFLFWLNNAWSLCGIILGLLIGLELVLALMEKTVQGDDLRCEADAYQYERATAWTIPYFHEWKVVAQSYRWEPYAYWRPEPFCGHYLTIDEQGLRKTWQATTSALTTTSYPTIFLFGGSTMWGEGVRDEGTIASQLSRQLYKAGLHAHIVNFGQLGYVSTQEVITLLRTLEMGGSPALVIFYDGYNDILSAVENSIAGVPYKEWHRRTEYGLSKRKYALLQAFLRLLACRQLLTRSKGERERVISQSIPKDQLITQIISTYITNMQVVEALGTRFGFQSLFFWQPTIFQKHFLTPYEQEQAHSIQYSKGYFLDVYHQMKNHPSLCIDTHFYNLDDLFLQEKRPYYIDWAHVTEEGNAKVAQRMAAVVVPLLQEQLQSAEKRGRV